MGTFLATPPLFFQTGNCLLCTGRDHPALRNTLLPRRLQQQLEQPQHLSIADPSSHFFDQEVMPDRVKVGSQIKVDHVGESPQDRFRDALERSMG